MRSLGGGIFSKTKAPKAPMNLERRTFIRNCGLAAPAALAVGCSASSNASSDETENDYPSLYDVSKPEDNLEAFAKVLGDLSGKPAWLKAKGIIYLIREGEMPLPFVGVEGLRYSKFERIDGGFKQYTRDWGFYKDLETDEILTAFNNPITGKTNPVKPLLTRYFGWNLLAETGQYMEGYEGEAWLMGRPFRLPWVRQGDDITVTLELLVKYASGIGGGEWKHLLTSASELNNPNTTSAHFRTIWTGHSPIMRWLEMDDIQGRTLWQSTGYKLDSADLIPTDFRNSVEATYPGSLEAPESYIKPS